MLSSVASDAGSPAHLDEWWLPFVDFAGFRIDAFASAFVFIGEFFGGVARDVVDGGWCNWDCVSVSHLPGAFYELVVGGRCSEEERMVMRSFALFSVLPAREEPNRSSWPQRFTEAFEPELEIAFSVGWREVFFIVR